MGDLTFQPDFVILNDSEGSLPACIYAMLANMHALLGSKLGGNVKKCKPKIQTFGNERNSWR